MSADLSPTDILSMAEQIEREAAAFFRMVADFSGKPVVRKAFRNLAEMETEHELVFSGLKAQLAPATDSGGTGNSREDWPMLAKLMVPDIREHLATQFTGEESPEQVLRRALAFEKDTIVLFLGLGQMLTSHGGQEIIQSIIKEELGHILMLTGQLAEQKLPGSTGAWGDAGPAETDSHPPSPEDGLKH